MFIAMCVETTDDNNKENNVYFLTIFDETCSCILFTLNHKYG